MTDKMITLGLQLLELEFGRDRVKAAMEAVKKFRVEVPSWVFGKFGGGRFGGYLPPGPARDIYEKLDDAAVVNKLTGATETVAMHVLWDFSPDGENGDYNLAKKIGQAAIDRGLRVGSVSPTYFLAGSQRGSMSAAEKATTDRYVEQTILGGRIAQDIGSKLLTIWLPDGSLYPGQIELRKAYETVIATLQAAYKSISKEVTILIEYKVFEPGTYSTLISDWGTAYLLAQKLGPNAGVLVDLGHHHHGTNIEQIVARLVSEKVKGGFHFNTRYAADDDHSVEPNQELARIFYELAVGGVVCNDDLDKNWAYMIDQCSGRENRMHAILHSVDSLQLSLAKAMLVDRANLEKYQAEDEIILANRTFNDALLHADVRPLVAAARLERNLPADPIAAYVESGYQKKIVEERG